MHSLTILRLRRRSDYSLKNDGQFRMTILFARLHERRLKSETFKLFIVFIFICQNSWRQNLKFFIQRIIEYFEVRMKGDLIKAEHSILETFSFAAIFTMTENVTGERAMRQEEFFSVRTKRKDDLGKHDFSMRGHGTDRSFTLSFYQYMHDLLLTWSLVGKEHTSLRKKETLKKFREEALPVNQQRGAGPIV